MTQEKLQEKKFAVACTHLSAIATRVLRVLRWCYGARCWQSAAEAAVLALYGLGGAHHHPASIRPNMQPPANRYYSVYYY